MTNRTMMVALTLGLCLVGPALAQSFPQPNFPPPPGPALNPIQEGPPSPGPQATPGPTTIQEVPMPPVAGETRGAPLPKVGGETQGPKPSTGSDVPSGPVSSDGPQSPPTDFLQPAPIASTGQWWTSFDYLMAWMRGDNVPALVTGAPVGTPQTAAGILGQSTTSVLYGGTTNDQFRSGFRIGTGYWFTPEKTLGIEAGFSMLESQASIFDAASTGSTIIARPFTDINTGLPQAHLIAFPGLTNGSVDVRVSSGNFYEAHFDFVEKVIDTGFVRLESIMGYRFYRYNEGLSISENLSPTSPNFAQGTQIASNDSFSTTNEFHGLDLGFRTKFSWDNLSLTVLTKIAVGHLERHVNINGTTVTSVPGTTTVVQNGGLYALSNNLGSYPNGDWTTMPEIGLNLNWQLNANWQMRLGYTLLYLDRVGRASDQVNTTINTTLLPNSTVPVTGPTSPNFQFIRSDVFIQSIKLGLVFTF